MDIILGVLLTFNPTTPIWYRNICVGLEDLESNCWSEPTTARSELDCIRGVSDDFWMTTAQNTFPDHTQPNVLIICTQLYSFTLRTRAHR